MLTDSPDIDQDRYTIIPVDLIKENGWKVIQKGKILQQLYTIEDYSYLKLPSDIIIDQACQTGKINFRLKTRHFIANETLKIDSMADFDTALQDIEVSYTCTNMTKEMKNICLVVEKLKSFNDKPQFTLYDCNDKRDNDVTGSSNQGEFFEYKVINDNWDGTITAFDLQPDNSDLPEAAVIKVYINNKVGDEIKINLKDVNHHD